MRLFLTTIAVLLIAVLTAALVVPYFIDWSQHRAQIEAQLSRALGLSAKLDGPLKAALLPTPYVTLGNLTIRDAKGDPIFSCRRARLELALAPLVRGQWRFTEATFDGARVELRRDANGGVELPSLTAGTAPESIGLDSITLRDATLALVGDGAPSLTIEGMQVAANADSLRGPFRGSGKANTKGRPFAFHFATGAAKGDAMPIKFVADYGPALNADFDGALSIGQASPLSYAGAASFVGLSGTTTWRLSGALTADLNGAKIDQMEARLGAEEERALSLQGSAEARFGAAAKLSATLAANELNVDALLRDKDAESAPPKRAAEALAASLSDAGFERGPSFPISVRIDSPAIILGGDTIADASLEASARPGAPLSVTLRASPPGARVSAAGAIELEPGAHFNGTISANLDDVPRLRDWLSQDDAALRARLSAISDALPYRSASLAGLVDISAASFAARDLSLGLGGSSLTGGAAFTAATGVDRARLSLDLKTDALDLDVLPNSTAIGQVLTDVDLSLALEARALRLARVGEGAIETGSLGMRVEKKGDEVTINHLSVADLGGATLEATGALKGGERWLNVDLNAASLRDFAAMTQRIAPGPLSEAFVERAGALSPAKLSFNAKAAGAPKDGAYTPDSLLVSGALGATRVNARLDRQTGGEGLAATLSLDAPEASALLRQLGVPALQLTGLGRGVVTARAEGDWSKGFSGEATAALAGADLDFSGRILGADALVEGSLKLKSANAMPLLACLGVAAQDARQSVAADLAAGVTWRENELSLSRIKGAVARANVLGDLSYRTDRGDGLPAEVEGAVSVDRLALSELASLALGPPQPPRTGAIWSDAKFSSALANPPTAALKLKIAALDLTGELVARDATLTLRVRPGVVAFDDLSMRISGGTVTSAATLRRDGANAALAGKIAFDSIAIDRPGFDAGLAGTLEFASTGQSPAGLVAGLAGSGVLRLSGAQVRRLDADALSRVVASAQRPDFDIEQIDLPRLLARELDRRALQIADASAPATITAGVVHAGPFEALRSTGDARAQIGFDLRTLNLDVQVAASERQAPKFWNGSPPAMSVAVRGPLDALTREVDAASLANGLESQAIARESARIADMEADIRERAAFNRVLKASRYMRQRELDLEAYAADQARLKSEADRRRVEAQTIKASEEAQRAADEARKAEEDARKANEIAPPLPADAAPSPAPSAIFAPTAVAPTPPTPPPRPSRTPVDPSSSGIY